MWGCRCPRVYGGSEGTCGEVRVGPGRVRQAGAGRAACRWQGMVLLGYAVVLMVGGWRLGGDAGGAQLAMAGGATGGALLRPRWTRAD